MKRTTALQNKISKTEKKVKALYVDYLKSIFLEIKNLESFQVHNCVSNNDGDDYTHYEISAINGVDLPSDDNDLGYLVNYIDENSEELEELAKSVNLTSDDLVLLYELVIEGIAPDFLTSISDRHITVGFTK